MRLQHGGYTPRIGGRPARDIQSVRLPEVLRVSFDRRGLHYEPLIADGQTVRRGEPLAEAGYRGSTLSLPAPASGVVSGVSAEGLAIRVAAEQRQSEPPARHSPDRLSGDEARRLLCRTGAWPFLWSSQTGGTPAADGSELPRAIAVNFVLSEPFRARGRVLLTSAWDHIISGIRFLPRLLADYGKVEIILTAVHDPVARRLAEELSGFAWTRLHAVPVTYPVENDRVLRAALRRQVRSYKPEDTIWTVDAQGVAALGAALAEGAPVHRRVVALGGPGVAHPRHLDVVVGTPLAAFLEADPGVMVLRGGLLTGEPVDPRSAAVEWDDDALFVLPVPQRRESLSFLRPGFTRRSLLPVFAGSIVGSSDTHITTSLRGERRPCIACGLCEQVCPAGLIPQVLHRYLYREAYEEAERAGLNHCVDCNLCTYVCPSKIELGRQFIDARAFIRAERQEAATRETQEARP